MSLEVKERTFYSKCRDFFKGSSLVFEFQTETIKLLVYNYVIVLLIANQEIGWNYPFKGVCSEIDSDCQRRNLKIANLEIANRYGHELISPRILTKFGFVFRLITVVINSLAMCTIIKPSRNFRCFLLPPILWNFYTITAITENILEIVWTMYILDVPFVLFSTIFIVGLFVVCLQSKLTLQVLRFYEFLNYAK